MILFLPILFTCNPVNGVNIILYNTFEGLLTRKVCIIICLQYIHFQASIMNGFH